MLFRSGGPENQILYFLVPRHLRLLPVHQDQAAQRPIGRFGREVEEVDQGMWLLPALPWCGIARAASISTRDGTGTLGANERRRRTVEALRRSSSVSPANCSTEERGEPGSMPGQGHGCDAAGELRRDRVADELARFDEQLRSTGEPLRPLEQSVMAAKQLGYPFSIGKIGRAHV